MIFIYDNILVFGASSEEHDQALRDALSVNFEKSWFNLWSMTFPGIVFQWKNFSPDPNKVDVLQGCRTAHNPKPHSYCLQELMVTL